MATPPERSALYRTIEAIGIACFLVMLAASLLQIVFRYLVPFPLMWTEELARLLAVLVTYYGSVVVWMRREHIRVDLIVPRLPRVPQRLVIIAVDVLIALFLAGFAYGCWLMIGATWQTYAASMAWLRMAYLYMAVGVAVLLLLFLVLRDIAHNTRSLVRPDDGGGL